MAPKKKKYSELSDSAKFYRDNPEARRKKAATDKKINERPDQEAKRRELGKKRYADAKKGKDIEGKDLSHTKKGLVYKNVKENRGSTSDSAGDRRSRGSKKNKK